MSNRRAKFTAKPKGSLLLGEQLCFALYSTSLAMTSVITCSSFGRPAELSRYLRGLPGMLAPK